MTRNLNKLPKQQSWGLFLQKSAEKGTRGPRWAPEPNSYLSSHTYSVERRAYIYKSRSSFSLSYFFLSAGIFNLHTTICMVLVIHGGRVMVFRVGAWCTARWCGVGRDIDQKLPWHRAPSPCFSPFFVAPHPRTRPSANSGSHAAESFIRICAHILRAKMTKVVRRVCKLLPMDVRHNRSYQDNAARTCERVSRFDRRATRFPFVFPPSPLISLALALHFHLFLCLRLPPPPPQTLTRAQAFCCHAGFIVFAFRISRELVLLSATTRKFFGPSQFRAGKTDDCDNFKNHGY